VLGITAGEYRAAYQRPGNGRRADQYERDLYTLVALEPLGGLISAQVARSLARLAHCLVR